MNTPPLSHLVEQGAYAFEFVCQVTTCRHKEIVDAAKLKAHHTVIDLKRMAKCPNCKRREMDVWPVWSAACETGLPTTYMSRPDKVD